MRSACCRQNSAHGLPGEQSAGFEQHELVPGLGAVQQRGEDVRRLSRRGDPGELAVSQQLGVEQPLQGLGESL